MPVQIPPWLDINPLEVARFRVAANQQRANMAQAELQAQVARERMQIEAEQHANALAVRQQEINEMGQYRRDEAARRREEGAALERLRQQKYEQDALEASIRMEGMRDYERGIANGENPAVAFSRNAHKLLYKNPSAMEKYVENIGEQGDLREYTTKGGAPYITRGGRPYFVPQTSLPKPAWRPSDVVLPSGLRGAMTSPNRFQFSDKGLASGQLSDVEKSQLTYFGRRETAIEKLLGDRNAKEISADPSMQKLQDELNEIRMRRADIYNTSRQRGLPRTPTAAATFDEGYPADADMPVINSKAEFDALDSGDWYINGKTGVPARKP